MLDDECMCADKCHKDNPQGACTDKEPILPDDGSGGDLSIPAMMIYKKEDSDAIRTAIKDDNQPLLVEISFGFNPDQRVKYTLWSTPTDPLSISILNEFPVIAKKLGDHASFEPRQYLFSGKDDYFDCTETDDKRCLGLCTNHGRYVHETLLIINSF